MHVKVFFSGAFSSTTNQIAHYIQTQFKPEDIMEAHSTIWRLRLEQARRYKGIIRVRCSGEIRASTEKRSRLYVQNDGAIGKLERRL